MFFFEKHSTDADAHHKHTRALISINTRTQSYLYEHLQEMLALVSNQELSKQAI